MTSGHLFSLGAEVGVSQGRLYSISAGVASARGRLYKLTATVPIPFVVNAGADKLNIEPGSTVTITATATGGTVNDWAFSSVPSVEFSGSGNSRSFIAPSGMSGQDVLVSVTASGVGAAPGSDTVLVRVLPQPEWIARDGVWKPRIRSVL